MIIGLGTDLVSVTRFRSQLVRTEGLRARLLPETLGIEYSVASLAGRFAAKEATLKALGGAPDSNWTWGDLVVESDANGRPALRVAGVLAGYAASLGISRWHLSLSHDGDFALATVIAESGDAAPTSTGSGESV